MSPSIWTADAVLALAPDPASARSGEALGAARQWASLGRGEHAVWGEIKGSGAKPYQARIDLREPAFKCSCPSRKFPCKHGIGLLLAFASDPAAFREAEPPAWVSDWLAGREQRSERKAEKAAAAPDPEAQRRRAGQREARVSEGLEQLHLWMRDLVRAGFAQAQVQPAAYWEGIAARLVDAQAPGLARLVRGLEETLHAGPGWEQRLLHALAAIELVRRTYVRRAVLPAPLVDEVRSAVGWTTREEDVLAAAAPVRDRWVVAGSVVSLEDRLRVRRTWLHGRESGRYALVLDFAIGTQPLAAGLPPGAETDAEVAFYPGTLALRGVVKAQHAVRPARESLSGVDVAGALEAYAEALARAPWIERWPMALAAVRLQRCADGASWALADGAGHRIGLAPRFPFAWQLLAIAGGETLDVFGEWDGAALHPLSAARGGQFYALADSVTAMREVA